MDRQDASTGATDANFGNAETIPAKPRYYANFTGDEINGRRYTIGEEIAEGVDAGTLRYLVQQGRITEKAEGDDNSLALGGETNIVPRPSRPAVISMDRAALLAELAESENDADLRRAVERKRDYEAEQARDREAAAKSGDGSTGSTSTTGESTVDAEAFIGRNLDDISDDEIAKLSDADREAVIKAERDREKPRKGLLDRLGATEA